METDIMEPENNIGKNIKQIREILGMSVSEVALRADMSANTLSRVERQKTVDDAMLDKIAAAMGVSSELIKKYDHEDTVNYIISNNRIEGAGGTIGIETNDNRVFNPVEKLSEVYERLLKEQKKNMQGEINELKKKLGE